MRPHVIEVGPNRIRRLCCGGTTVDDPEAEAVALHSIDDQVALVELQPVAVPSLWRDVLSAIACGADGVTVLHPSWWSPDRVAVVSAAAKTVLGGAHVHPRSWLLTQAATRRAGACDIVVEITDCLVGISGPWVVAESRRRGRGAVAEAVARSVRAMASETGQTTVIIDAPATVLDAATLAVTIAKRLTQLTVLTVNDLRWRTLVAEHVRTPTQEPERRAWSFAPRRRWAPVAVVAVVMAASVLLAGPRPRAPAARRGVATTYTVEGHVAVQLPADWSVRRVIAGPGSARLQITSPNDPENALHLTQSRVALTGLAATAEFLKSAIDAAPAGVFVDFNPADSRAGHPVATYREIRAGHDIRWTVWVDKAVRISIGCQSRRGRDDAVDRECDAAVRSARALD